MRKLSGILHNRCHLFEKLSQVAGISSVAGASSVRGAYLQRVVAPYSVYKGKAALRASPILPAFTKSDSGSLVVDRRGAMMLTFMPAIGERKYDWEKKQFFALSATEMGCLISLGPKDSCDFFHDPSMQTSNAGQVKKTFSVKPHADGSGYFISLNVINNNMKTTDRITVPISTAEFAVLRTAFSFALPHIIGWDRYTNQALPSAGEKLLRSDPQLLDSEWDK